MDQSMLLVQELYAALKLTSVAPWCCEASGIDVELQRIIEQRNCLDEEQRGRELVHDRIRGSQIHSTDETEGPAEGNSSQSVQGAYIRAW